MSDLEKSVSPALKLMKVFTTATAASEMPIAATTPSSRTNPDDCRVNIPAALVGAAPAVSDVLILAPPWCDEFILSGHYVRSCDNSTLA
jgi:hypothetical protein